MSTNVAAVFVNFRSSELVAARAERLLAAGVPVIVADNSGDFAVEGVPTVATGGNVGFGAACNRAVAGLDPATRVLCFHNPDVDIAPEAILALADGAVNGIGALAPAIRTDGVIREHGYHYPSPLREAYLSARAIGSARAANPDPPAPTKHVSDRGRRFGTAALLVVNRDAFTRVGGFDERYFLYVEDLDLWHRLAKAGFTNRFVPEVVATHIGAAGSPMSMPTRELLRWLGIELFAQTHLVKGWRPFRAAHRPFLRSIQAPPELVSAVSNAWRSASAPATVCAALRPILEGRAQAAV